MVHRTFIFVMALLINAGHTFAAPGTQTTNPTMPTTAPVARYLTVSESLNDVPMGKYMDIIEDKKGDLTVKDLSNPPYREQFTPSIEDSPKHGFTKSAHWARFVLFNPTDRPLEMYLEHRYPQTDFITLFTPTNTPEGYRAEQIGDNVAYAKREIHHRYPTFKMLVPPGQWTYFLRVQTSGSNIFPFYLWSKPHFLLYLPLDYLYLGILLGSLIVMILYNFFLVISLRSLSYLYYIGYLSGFLLAQLAQTGLGQMLFFPSIDHNWISNEGLVVGVETAGISASLFAINFLELRTVAKPLFRTLQVLVTIFSLNLLNLFIFGYDYSAKIATIDTAMISIALIVTGFTGCLRGYRPSYFFTIAWALMLVGGLGHVLKIEGLVGSNFFTVWGQITGGMLEAVLLSFALADHVNLIKAQNAKLIKERADTHEKIMHMQEEHIKVLDIKVEERTAALNQKTNDIDAILQNMNQGILTIALHNKIHPEYSKYLETILQKSSGIADSDAVTALFEHSDLTNEAKSQLSSALLSIIGEDEVAFSFNHNLLPSTCELLFDGIRKSIELEWNPIITNNMVDKVIVTVRDVTELRTLQKESSDQKNELEIIGEILAVPRSAFLKFISSTRDFIEQNAQLIHQSKHREKEVLALIFRNMHTIKGNARTLGFKGVSQAAHHVEQTYDELRLNENTEWSRIQLIYDLKIVENVIDKYSDIATTKLGITKEENENTVILDKTMFSLAVTALNDIPRLDTDDATRTLTKVKDLLSTADVCSIHETLDGILRSLPTIAKELGKEPPKVDIINSHFRISIVEDELIKNVLTHTFLNSLDHGIESTEERKKADKDPAGHISISFWLQKGQLTIKQRDDGKGLNMQKIRQKAEALRLIDKNSILSAQQIADLVFVSGLTTAQKVSHNSGRGVGMDAVKRFVEDNGGKVELVLANTDSTAEYIPFELVITIPHQLNTELANAKIATQAA